jgi:hypothetical protein
MNGDAQASHPARGGAVEAMSNESPRGADRSDDQRVVIW